MNANDFWTSLEGEFAPQLLSILGALGILVIGWLLAVIVRAVVRRGLAMTRLDERLGRSIGSEVSIERPVSLAFFWLVILMTVVGVFSALDLTNVSSPIEAMVTQVTSYLPQLLGAVVLLLIAWLVATLSRLLVSRVLKSTRLDDRLSRQAGMEPMSENLSTALFWLVMLMFVPAIVGVLGLSGLLGPLNAMANEIFGMLPNIFAALLIAGVGWLLARILRGLVSSALSAMGLDKFSLRAGDGQDQQLSRAAGAVVFVLVLVPTAVAALDALAIQSIAQPAQAMLGEFLAAIPDIIAALLILGIAYVVARLVSDLVTRLSASAGVDSWPRKAGVETAVPESARPSRILGSLVLFFSMLFAATEASNQLGMERLGELLGVFVLFAADVLLGAVVLVVGFVLAGFAYNAIRQSGASHGGLLAQIARVAIIGLVLAMGLRAMGIADDIVNLGFGLTLGAIAVAIALAFGLGGREAAARLLERWVDQLGWSEKAHRGPGP